MMWTGGRLTTSARVVLGPAYGSHAQPTDDTDSVQLRTFDIDFSWGCLENEPQGQPGAHF